MREPKEFSIKKSPLLWDLQIDRYHSFVTISPAYTSNEKK